MRTARLRPDVWSLCVGLLLVLSTSGIAQTQVIDPRVEMILRSAALDEELAVIVRFAGRVDVRDSELRKAFESLGASDIVVLWVIHSIAATVPARAIPELASRPGVENIRLDEPATLPQRPADTGGERTATAPPQPVVADHAPDSGVPSVPAGLMTTDTTQTTVTLAWEAPADSGGGTSYRLYEYAWVNHFRSHWVSKLDGITTLSTTVTGLTPGSTQRYAVTAVDAAGNESARSVPVEIRTLQPPRAYHPIDTSDEKVFAVVGEPWTHAVDAIGHPAPEFSLVAGPTGMGVDAQSGIVGWTPAAGEEGVATATVRASNSQGRDDHTFSVRVDPAGTDRIPPSSVRTLVATKITANGCSLTWKAATDNVGVAGYLIVAQRFGRGGSLIIAGESAGPGTTHTVTTLKPGTGYRLWVAAYDASGNRASISGVPPAVIITSAAEAK